MAEGFLGVTGVLGENSLEFLNECLFTTAPSCDVGLEQLHAQVPSLLAALAADD